LRKAFNSETLPSWSVLREDGEAHGLTSKTKSHELRASDYCFVVERMASRLGLNYFVLASMLAIIPFVLNVALRLILIMVLGADYLRPYLFSELAWLYPGVLSVLATSFFAKRLRDQAVTTVNSLTEYVKEPNLFSSSVSRIFGTRHHWLAATAFAAAAMVIETMLIIVLPPPWWAVWYVSAFVPTVVLATVTTISTGITYFFAAMMAYFCLSTSYLVFGLLKSFRTDTEIEKVEGIRFRGIGEFSLTIGTSWVLAVGLLLAQLAVASTTWLTLLQVSIFLVLSISLFLAPLVKTHYLMKGIKERADKELSGLQWRRFGELRSLVSARDHSQVRARITALTMLLQSLQAYRERIDLIPTWPLNSLMLAELVVAMIAQVVSVLLNSPFTGLVRP
jgi:hypothetical protein